MPFCCVIGVAAAAMRGGDVLERAARARLGARLPAAAGRRNVLPAAAPSSASTGRSRTMTSA
jgi:hypothetical protein